MGPELLFVDDFFGPPSERMNTIFKLYYQAWLLLAAASGFAIYYWRSGRDSLTGWRRSLSTLWAVGAIALIIGALYYPAAASTSKATAATWVSSPSSPPMPAPEAPEAPERVY